jgi:hypothetical protein
MFLRAFGIQTFPTLKMRKLNSFSLFQGSASTVAAFKIGVKHSYASFGGRDISSEISLLQEPDSPGGS